MFWNKKKDHSETIEKIATELAHGDQKTGVLPFLSMKEATAYARTTSDTSPLISPDFVQCHAEIAGAIYNLEFKPHPEKGVYLSAFYYGKKGEI